MQNIICQFLTYNALVHGRKDVKVSSRQKQTPDDENALKDEDHVAKVIEEPDRDVNPETEQEMASAKDAK